MVHDVRCKFDLPHSCVITTPCHTTHQSHHLLSLHHASGVVDGGELSSRHLVAHISPIIQWPTMHTLSNISVHEVQMLVITGAMDNLMMRVGKPIGWCMMFVVSSICRIRASSPRHVIQPTNAIIYYHCTMRVVSWMVQSGVLDSFVILWPIIQWPTMHTLSNISVQVVQMLVITGVMDNLMMRVDVNPLDGAWCSL